MFRKVEYNDLNAKQKENYNFHKIAARLADYGYHSMKLSDDYMGADFIALHMNGQDLLKVQLKGRMTLSKKYVGKGLHIAFINGDEMFVYPHDTLVADLQGTWRDSKSWMADNGEYHWGTLSKSIRSQLKPYSI
ncbi:hypothetical protein JQX09_23505 [Sulfitobacter pseudonitzschiae]|uniref:Uncharacterized protein n=1 Tax=Pseudosulfitobacter pseudonitzschiae TaxID=1402135 RepID=A0A9Q2P6V9_9RHOB|nr:hypothetical protein [Pseudosulfitobacter pseudonitzschiae]MBM2294900.1 hypothetical protein [Pseudosulfitobacter pseudonitzschiae]MBM2299816.1 hypothetical protein [Pseudosulfitobacter pseudonitzschiae]MBM2304737.1 hypothetical protein [Pseudosulfitobacter pseudonitzschiae]MBM2314511.1 hypothetical protein [Pseudosulfitobacter pseudonitzschiae]MBM2319421.1 hypothetical protein [Pseudosulfitobacter pseudonitzschiae]